MRVDRAVGIDFRRQGPRLLSGSTTAVLNTLISEPGTLHVHFALGLANYVAHPAVRINDCPAQDVLCKPFFRILGGTDQLPSGIRVHLEEDPEFIID